MSTPFSTPFLSAFLPDLALLVLALVVLTTEIVFRKHQARWTARVAVAGLAAVLILLAALPLPSGGVAYAGYQVTRSVVVWKQLFALATLATILLSRSYFRNGHSLRGALANPGAFYGLLLFSTTGMFALVSARDLLTFYIGLELATLPLYALTALQPRNAGSIEAGSKYMLMGAFASALSLFGISFLYGAAGSLGFDALAKVASAQPSLSAQPFLLAGVLMLLGSLGFKLAMVPFQMWAPDVYEGAPTAVTAFLSTGSKAAAVAATTTLFLGPLNLPRIDLGAIFALAAVLSLLAGTLGAMRQSNLRRFIAYSSIAQAGYMLMAFTGGEGSEAAARIALQYNLLVYGTASFALFFVVSLVGRSAPETIPSLRGLSARSPALAALLALSLFSLIGIPPLAGFLGKFLLFAVAARNGHYTLIFIGALAVALSFYYYMRLLKEAYQPVQTAENRGAPASAVPLSPIRLSLAGKCAAALLAILLVVLGTCPGMLNFIASR